MAYSKKLPFGKNNGKQEKYINTACFENSEAALHHDKNFTNMPESKRLIHGIFLDLHIKYPPGLW